MTEDFEFEGEEIDEVWESLTPEQKKFFKKIAEKSEENLRYIG